MRQVRVQLRAKQSYQTQAKIIEQIASNKIEQIKSKKVDVSKTIEQNTSKTIKLGSEKYFLTCIDNIQAKYSESISLTTKFGRNNAKKIFISAMDQPTDTNRTRMEHLLLSAVNLGSKDITIGSEWLDKNIITEANQSRNYIDRRGNSDRNSPFGSCKSGDEMSVDFGRNVDDKISMNPLRTI